MDTTVKQIAPQNNVVQAFQVAKAGVQAVSKDGKQWVVLIYGQQQVTNKTVTTGPRLDISSAVVTLNKVSGQWLISNLTTPPDSRPAAGQASALIHDRPCTMLDAGRPARHPF